MSPLFNPGYCDEHELRAAGIKAVGRNVRIFRNCNIVGLEHISIGNNVRIDGYCTIIAGPAGIRLGSYIHIASYVLISAGEGVEMEDFTALSHGARVYTRNDDYSGEHLTNPMIPAKYLGIKRGAVTLRRHAIVGSGSVILPGATLGEGAAVGALSLVNRNLDAWGVYFGCPVRRISERSKRLLDLEKELHAEESGLDLAPG